LRGLGASSGSAATRPDRTIPIQDRRHQSRPPDDFRAAVTEISYAGRGAHWFDKSRPALSAGCCCAAFSTALTLNLGVKHIKIVDDLETLMAEIAQRETYSNGVRKRAYIDPDGNEVGFGEVPSRSGAADFYASSIRAGPIEHR
jgi:hypothetical protein